MKVELIRVFPPHMDDDLYVRLAPGQRLLVNQDSKALEVVSNQVVEDARLGVHRQLVVRDYHPQVKCCRNPIATER